MEVVDSAVASFTADEVVGTDGIARPVDVVIMGTGFEAAEPPYAEHIVGCDEARLSEVWKAHGAQAYLGSTVAGFPNLFLMIGPNSTLAHNSMIYMIESHINYISSAAGVLGASRVRTVEVKPFVQRRYNERLQARLAHSVWSLPNREQQSSLQPRPLRRAREPCSSSDVNHVHEAMSHGHGHEQHGHEP